LLPPKSAPPRGADLSPVAAAAAALYFPFDAIFLSAVKTIIRPLPGVVQIANIHRSGRMARLAQSLLHAGAAPRARDPTEFGNNEWNALRHQSEDERHVAPSRSI
jgi:hypothetical protein